MPSNPVRPTHIIQSPFARLRDLLKDIEPGLPPIDMTIGEPRHDMPDFVAGILARRHDEFAKYPPIDGTADLRTAIAGWLKRRYPLLDTHKNLDDCILPLSGSREGLFSALFPARTRKKVDGTPVVFIPNPFYQVYAAAALAAGCEPVFLPCSIETGFLPDLDALDEA